MHPSSRFLKVPIEWLAVMLVMVGCHASKPTNEEANPNLETVRGDGNVNRTELTYAFLNDGSQDATVDFSHYAVPAHAAFPSNTFEGRLTLRNLATSGQFREIKDIFDYADSVDSERRHLPPFDYEFVQTGSHIVPLKRGYLENEHPTWEYILEPGRVWDEANDQGFSRVAIPFTLKQKNQNCLHNGVLTFLFKDDGTTSSVAYQIASETCGYFKFDMWGTVAATYAPYSIPAQEEHVQNYVAEVTGRMPTRPISELSKDYPNAQPNQFSAPKEVTPEHMTLYGFVIDSINYVGGCETRLGTYPFCEVLNVPSYSTAKSISAGMGLMRMEKLYPGSRTTLVGNLVSECNNGNWSDVTMENALDMTTGNYETATPFKDEGASHTNQFFMPEDHESKIAYSCAYYSRKATPGDSLVYHTSDTYILGTAMNAYLRQKTDNPEADYFEDIIVEDIFKPLGISPTSKITQRTYDSIAQPFSGYGLIYHHDDVAKIGQFLNNGARIDRQEMLDQDLFSSIMDTGKTSGLSANASGTRYDNGFWLQPLDSLDDKLIPSIEGYGGIKILLLPNNTVYYYFSDNYEYAWKEAAREARRIRPF